MTVTSIASGTTISAGYLISTPGLTLVNAGVLGSTAALFGVQLKVASTVTNQMGGTITGKTDGVTSAVGLLGTIDNYGQISGAGFGVDLAGGGPVTNQAKAGTISGGVGVRLNGTSDTVANAGYIQGTAGAGIYLRATGAITNTAGGRILGSTYGVTAAAAMTLENAGLITGSGGTAVRFKAGKGNALKFDPGGSFAGIVDGGNVVGAVSISTLELASGASIGALTGLSSQYLDFAQVTEDANADWVVDGVNTIVSGATLTNNGTLTDGGTLTVAGSMTNSGMVNGYLGVTAGGVVTNAAGGTISAAGTGVFETGVGATMTNAGAITGGVGVELVGAGTNIDSNAFTNSRGGVITGAVEGVVINGSYGTLINGGSISGAGVTEVGIDVGAIEILSVVGALVTNQPSGAISGVIDGIYAKGQPANPTALSIVNAGDLSGVQRNGIHLAKGGSISNQSGGTIGGADYGVILGVHTLFLDTNKDGFAATVDNAGQITGGNGTAVYFTSGYFSRMILRPGASFSGIVNGGNTIGATIVTTVAGNTTVSSLYSTLELGQGAAGGPAIGAFSGIGSEYINFAQVTVDAGASWAFTGTNTFAGVSLTDSGVLTNTGSIDLIPPSTTVVPRNGAFGLYVAAGGLLTNASTATITALADPVLVLSNAGPVGTLVNAGSIGATATFAPGFNGGVLLDPGTSLTNQSGGLIIGPDCGVLFIHASGSGAASVTNLAGGTIRGNVGLYAPSSVVGLVSVVNSGVVAGISSITSGGSTVVGAGVRLAGGADITNLAGGTISGYDGIQLAGEYGGECRNHHRDRRRGQIGRGRVLRERRQSSGDRPGCGVRRTGERRHHDWGASGQHPGTGIRNLGGDAERARCAIRQFRTDRGRPGRVMDLDRRRHARRRRDADRPGRAATERDHRDRWRLGDCRQRHRRRRRADGLRWRVVVRQLELRGRRRRRGPTFDRRRRHRQRVRRDRGRGAGRFRHHNGHRRRIRADQQRFVRGRLRRSGRTRHRGGRHRANQRWPGRRDRGVGVRLLCRRVRRRFQSPGRRYACRRRLRLWFAGPVAWGRRSPPERSPSRSPAAMAMCRWPAREPLWMSPAL